MEEDVTLEHEGETYTASYIEIDDELLTYLPDGSERRTELRGLNPEQTARNHLRGYINNQQRSKDKEGK
jgi:hypothetical protein